MLFFETFCLSKNPEKNSSPFLQKILSSITVFNIDNIKGVIWCDFKFSFLFGVLQADCA